MATKKDIDPELTNRQIGNARGQVAARLSKLLTREANIGLGQIKASSIEVAALKNQIGRLMPQLQDVTVKKEELNPKELESEFNKLMARANKDTKDAIDDNKVSPITNAKSSNSKV